MIDEEEAAKTLEALRDLGEVQETMAALAAGQDALAGGTRMKYATEFRDPKAARAVLAAIAQTVDQIGATKRKAPAHHGDLWRPHPCDLSLWSGQTGA